MFSIAVKQLGKVSSNFHSSLTPITRGRFHALPSYISQVCMHRYPRLVGKVCAFSSSKPAEKTALAIDSAANQTWTSLWRKPVEKVQKTEETAINYLLEGSKQKNMGNFQQAIENYTLAILNDGDPYRVAVSRFNRGNLYRRMQLFDKALADFKELLVEKNRFFQSDAFRYLSYVYQEMGWDSQAVAILKEGVNTTPDSLYLLYELGKLHLKMHNIPQSLSCFEQVIKLADNDDLLELDENLMNFIQRLKTVTLSRLRIDIKSEALEIYKDLVQAQALFPIYNR